MIFLPTPESHFTARRYIRQPFGNLEVRLSVAPRKGISAKIPLTEEEIDQLLGDDGQLRQVPFNVLSNAICDVLYKTLALQLDIPECTATKSRLVEAVLKDGTSFRVTAHWFCWTAPPYRLAFFESILKASSIAEVPQ